MPKCVFMQNCGISRGRLHAVDGCPAADVTAILMRIQISSITVPGGIDMLTDIGTIIQGIRQGCIPAQVSEGRMFAVTRFPEGKQLVVTGGQHPGRDLDGEQTEAGGAPVFVGPLSSHNALALMCHFPYTAPVPHRGRPFTLGLGDRLGIASGGHLHAIRGRGVFPVLAQQSIRELNLTGRTYEEVLAAAAFAVFEEGYTDGYGADGDHLKTPDEIRYALRCGYTMITLDCSEQIDNTAAGLGEAEAKALYESLPADLREHYEEKYLGRQVPVDGGPFIDLERLVRIVLVYQAAISYTVGIYHSLIVTAGRPIDFEMSIDETLTSTDPAAHYIVARELLDADVVVTSLAPRFCGEFQKGIDYIGDPARFETEFALHARIADLLGYKISVHSGSDKFTIFPAVGRLTQERVHVKTAGTSWLEALRVIAVREPALYRELHVFALEHVEEARRYYHIGTSSDTIPALDVTPDDRLSCYLDRDDARQALHISYGLILQAGKASGEISFRERIYTGLYRHEDAYTAGLIRHIGKHLDALGK